MLGITRSYILTELREVLEQAKAEGKLGLANRALEPLAKLRGDLTDRSEVKTREVQIVLNGVNVENLQ